MDYLQAEITKIENNIKENENLLNTETDEDIKKLITEDIESLNKQKELLEKSVATVNGDYSTTEETEEESILDINPNVATLEIRAGTGGSEAGIFANDLYRMYTRYAEKNKWHIEELFRSEGEHNSIKTIMSEFKGHEAYNLLKNESGVHRVQRIPVTESGGRIHTSTATVAVLPKVRKIDIEIKPEDLSWEFYRAGGHGGQNVNKVSTAVRLTHIPTGIIVESQEERFQGKNREKALDTLNSKIYSMMQEQQVKSLTDLRSDQVGTGDRTEKIRTYNYPQDRVTDHRIGKSWHNMMGIMNGDIDKIIEDCSNLSKAAVASIAPEEEY